MDGTAELHWVGELVERDENTQALAQSVQAGVLRQQEELEELLAREDRPGE